jgi:hypothetical protein
MVFVVIVLVVAMLDVDVNRWFKRPRDGGDLL